MNVAVVIPLFNGAGWIAGTLGSVVRQTRPPAEIVVVDDGSADGSPEIVRTFSGVRLLTNPENGANPARRFGLGQTRSPLVAMVDQDDLWHECHLERLVPWIAARPECAAVCAAECSLSQSRPEPEWKLDDTRWQTRDAWSHFPIGPCVGTPSAVVIRRDALDAIGGWPCQHPGAADYFTWLGLSANGTARTGMAASLACTVAYRRHRTGMSATLRGKASLESYAGIVLRASLDAADRFGARSSLDEATLARRILLAKAIHLTLTTFAQRDWGTLTENARAMLSLVQSEPEFFRQRLAGMLVWMFDGPLPVTEAAEVMDRTLAHWPGGDPYTPMLLRRRREAIRQYAAGSSRIA